MEKKEKELNKGEIVIYKDKRSKINLDVRFEGETVWLTQEKIANLFGVKRPAVTKHLKNIFKEGELKENSVSSILEHTASDGKKYKTKFYNPDAIVSVGYRVNSKAATSFRIWATEKLKDYLVNGYIINQKRLQNLNEKKLEEFKIRAGRNSSFFL